MFPDHRRGNLVRSESGASTRLSASRRRIASRQRGMGLIAAIFVITVMALLTVGLARLVVTGQQSYGYELLSARAFLAAESALQIQNYAVIPPGGGGTCSVSTAIASFAAEGLQGCEATVFCDAIGPISGVTYYSLEAEGRCGIGIDLAIRRIASRIQL